MVRCLFILRLAAIECSPHLFDLVLQDFSGEGSTKSVYLALCQLNKLQTEQLGFDLGSARELVKGLIRTIAEQDARCHEIALREGELQPPSQSEEKTMDRASKLEAAKKRREALVQQMASKRSNFEKTHAEALKADTKVETEDDALSYDCMICQTSQPDKPVGLIAFCSKSDVLKSVLTAPTDRKSVV